VMATKYPELWQALRAEFRPEEHYVLDKNKGGKFTYLRTPSLRRRLNEVIGEENWWCDYEPLPSGKGFLCRLTLRLPGGEVLTRADAGGDAGMADAGDDEKSAVTDAFKRACATFGVGEYLWEKPGARPPAQAPAKSRATDPTPAGMLGWIKEWESKGVDKLFFRMRQWLLEREWPERYTDLKPDDFAFAVNACRQKIAADIPTEKLPGNLKPLSEEDWHTEAQETRHGEFCDRIEAFAKAAKVDASVLVSALFDRFRTAKLSLASAAVPGQGPDWQHRLSQVFLINERYPVYVAAVIRKVGAELKSSRKADPAIAAVENGAYA